LRLSVSYDVKPLLLLDDELAYKMGDILKAGFDL